MSSNISKKKSKVSLTLKNEKKILKYLAKQPKSTTPKEISPLIVNLLSQITDKAPFYVNVEPAWFATEGYCYHNVERQVKSKGGKSVYGVIIWECVDTLNFEVHAIWQKPDNTYLCITPKSNGVKTILFAPFRDDKQYFPHKGILAYHYGKTQIARKGLKIVERLDKQVKILTTNNTLSQ
jgi:hypothetical protein